MNDVVATIEHNGIPRTGRITTEVSLEDQETTVKLGEREIMIYPTTSPTSAFDRFCEEFDPTFRVPATNPNPDVDLTKVERGLTEKDLRPLLEQG